MKKMMISALVALASIGLGHVAPAEAAAEHNSYRYKGDSATAYFWNYEESADGYCGVYTGVDVYAHSQKFKMEPGAPSDGGYLSVYVYQYDSCTWTSLVSGYGSTSDFDLSMQGMNSAVVSATLELHDWMSNMSVPVEVNLVLTGQGDAFHGMNNSLQRAGNYMVKTRENGSYRMASGAGSVVANGVEIPIGGDAYAQLSSVQYGSSSTFKF